MQRLQLDVSVRDGGGKGAARKLRAAGRVPAILYGGGAEPVKLDIDNHELEKIVKTGSNALIDLKGAKEVKGKLVLIKAMQRDPLHRNALHCDLYAVDTAKRITVQVPLHYEGKPIGVELGGVMDVLARDLEVSCLPLEIPDAIEVDVSELDIGHSVHIRDLTLPEGVTLLQDESVSIVHVIAARVEAEPEAEEGEGEVEGGEAPVEAEGDKAPSDGGGESSDS